MTAERDPLDRLRDILDEETHPSGSVARTLRLMERKVLPQVAKDSIDRLGDLLKDGDR